MIGDSESAKVQSEQVGSREASNTSMHGVRETDIDFVELLLTVWKHRFWILIITAISTLMGLVYAFLAPPVYQTQAIIALKEAGKGNDASRLFSQLGGMGGIVASQLGFGNTNLDKIEIILKGNELAKEVISGNNLLPALFPEVWNKTDSSWNVRDPSKIPTQRQGVRLLRQKMLAVSVDSKRGIIRVEVNAHDSTLAKQIVDYYLKALNDKIRGDVISDSELNREYLERQLKNTLDPTLREKILNMIGFEIEKSMLISTRAFEILEEAVVPHERSKPKRKEIAIFSFMIGLMASLSVTIGRKSVVALQKNIARRR